jgi:hypothetical protein
MERVFVCVYVWWDREVSVPVQQLVLKAAAHDVFVESATPVHRQHGVSAVVGAVVGACASPELSRQIHIEHVFVRHQDLGEEAGVALFVVHKPGGQTPEVACGGHHHCVHTPGIGSIGAIGSIFFFPRFFCSSIRGGEGCARAYGQLVLRLDHGLPKLDFELYEEVRVLQLRDYAQHLEPLRVLALEEATQLLPLLRLGPRLEQLRVGVLGDSTGVFL